MRATRQYSLLLLLCSLQNTLNPVWTTILFVDIDAGTYMPFRVSIYDDNVNNEDKLMAEATFEMTGVYQSPGNTQVEELDGNGTICVSVEESVRGDSFGTFDLHIRGLHLKNVESGPLGLGRSDPFYELSKKNADYDKGIVRWNPVYRSETITDNLNPFFAAQPSMSLEAVCYCDIDWPLRITIFDWERNGKHKLIGQFDTTVNELKSRVSVHGNADQDCAFELVKEGRDTSRGLVVVLRANVNLN